LATDWISALTDRPHRRIQKVSRSSLLALRVEQAVRISRQVNGSCGTGAFVLDELTIDEMVKGKGLNGR